MEKLTNEAACDALYLIQPKQEVLDELEITYDCEDNKELVTPKKKLCDTSPQRDGDVNEQNVNMVMPIKTELILSDDLAQLHTQQQLSDHENVPHVLQIKGERDTEASVAADCAPARDSTLPMNCPQSQSIGAATNKELFTCNVCQKQLKYKSALVFHMRTHTGEKPFSCDRCQRKFIERSKLTRHARTHSGEKPFTCDICKKRFTENENIFQNWLEEKVDLPIFENISQVGERVEPPAAPVASLPQPTVVLLQFETVYGAVELTHLTPPQTPPGPATQLMLLDLEGESQALEELVGLSAPSSPRPSTDEDWCVPAGRPEPHSHRSRKEQNKNAATRYRQKKKAEIEVLLGEERNLRERRSELGDKCSDLRREIRCLKGLTRDLFKAKGLIK